MSVRVLLATDFDGTIAPIVDDPAVAEIHPSAKSFFESIDRADIAVAVLSGRDVEDVRRRMRGVRAIIAGAHGLECEDAEGHLLWTCSHSFPEPPPELLASLQGFRMERKKYAMALHFRGAEPRGVESFVDWAHERELQVIHGRMVVEARVPGGGKGPALRRIAGRIGARRVVYAGDDATDFDALAFAASHGRAAFITSSERAAPDVLGVARVGGVEDLCAFFAGELHG